MNQSPLELKRPQFHFTPPSQWLNDPNGLIYFDGEYHLFYQYRPDSLVHGPLHWGHAVSTDLMRWEHLSIALYPDRIGQIWSGSVVVDRENTSGLVAGGGLVAIFSYHDQSQGIAYSQDRGRTWTMYDGNPVIPTPGTDFRDPKVFWHDETGQWVMIIVKGEIAQIYHSPDLIHWTLASEFGERQGAHGAIWEVPDLFPLEIDGETRWVMLISVGDGAPAGGCGIQYFVGSFDGTTFVNDNPPDITLWLDFGPDNYAGTTWNDAPDDRRVYIGWMNNWCYGREIPATTWRGSMTVPREFRLRHTSAGLRLVQTSVEQIIALRGDGQHWANERLLPGENLLADVRGQVLDIVAEFEPGTAVAFGFKVHQGATCETVIVYDVQQQQLIVNRERSGVVDFHPQFSGIYSALLVPIEDRIKMRILVDQASVEVFGNNGEVTITAQVFPLVDSDGLEVFTVGGDVNLVTLAVYPLNKLSERKRSL